MCSHYSSYPPVSLPVCFWLLHGHGINVMSGVSTQARALRITALPQTPPLTNSPGSSGMTTRAPATLSPRTFPLPCGGDKTRWTSLCTSSCFGWFHSYTCWYFYQLDGFFYMSLPEASVLIQLCSKKQVVDCDCTGIREILLLGLCMTFLFSLWLKKNIGF